MLLWISKNKINNKSPSFVNLNAPIKNSPLFVNMNEAKINIEMQCISLINELVIEIGYIILITFVQKMFWEMNENAIIYPNFLNGVLQQLM